MQSSTFPGANSLVIPVVFMSSKDKMFYYAYL